MSTKDAPAAQPVHALSGTVARRLRIGLIVSDPLRVRGFVALFGHVAHVESVKPNETVRQTDLSMVVLDANERLFPLLAAFRRARAGLRILVLGDSINPSYISRVVAAGAKGYLPYGCSAAEMETAISVVADGSIWAPRKVLSSLIDTLSPEGPLRPRVEFTPREREMLQLLVLGLPDREIARELGVSVRTVQSMVRELLKRVGVTNRVALTVYVAEKHLIL